MNLTDLELEDNGRLFIEIHLIELLIQQLYFISPHFPVFISLSSSWLYFIIVFLAIIYSSHCFFHSSLFLLWLSPSSSLFIICEFPWPYLCISSFICVGTLTKSYRKRGEQKSNKCIASCSVHSY